MPVIPNQLRSVDPWSENRFSDNYNLRSRMLTSGVDAIVYPDSFTITRMSDTVIRIGAGVAIKDDVMLHIMDLVTIDLTAADGYMYGGEGEPPISNPLGAFNLHLLLTYNYNRSIPAPSARYNFTRYPEVHFLPVNHLWLGRVFGMNNVITGVSTEPIRIPDNETGIVYQRHVIDPLTGYTTVNGGVIRPPTPGGSPDGWYEEWQYI